MRVAGQQLTSRQEKDSSAHLYNRSMLHHVVRINGSIYTALKRFTVVFENNTATLSKKAFSTQALIG